jgi:hypothetical protein
VSCKRVTVSPARWAVLANGPGARMDVVAVCVEREVAQDLAYVMRRRRDVQPQPDPPLVGYPIVDLGPHAVVVPVLLESP